MPICPHCNEGFATHPEVCKWHNSRTYGQTQLNNINKQSKGLGKYLERQKTFIEIFDIVDKMKSGEIIYTKKLLEHYGTTRHSSGDIYQNFLDLLVCRGYLMKTFNPKGHTYIKREKIIACPFLSITKNKKGKEKINCVFNWINDKIILKFTRKDFNNE